MLQDVDYQRIENQGGSLLTETKARAMKTAVTDFYSRYDGQSWKNIISIGDAFFEHDAIRQVTAEHALNGAVTKKCRTKTLKLLEGPSMNGVLVQLSIIENWLSKIVEFDNNIDIDFSADEDQISQWVAQFGEADDAETGSTSQVQGSDESEAPSQAPGRRQI